jgi:hypothetical protein
MESVYQPLGAGLAFVRVAEKDVSHIHDSFGTAMESAFLNHFFAGLNRPL